MTLHAQENGNGDNPTAPLHPRSKQRRGCHIAILVCLLLLIALILVVVILAVTVFKIKQPRTQLQHTSLEGVAPRVSFPAFKVELNVTLNLTLLVENRNHASFKGAKGESVLLYKGGQVGDVQVDPGLIPARGNTSLVCLLTLEVDRFAESGLMSLISDIMDGEVTMETKTRIPGRVTFLGIFRKHVVATSDCQIVIGFPDFKIKSQDCEQHTKL